MEREKKPKHFLQQPEFPGGPKGLTKFIYSHLRYPAEALEARIEGTVYLEYDIDHLGKVVETRLLRGLGFGCDEEAARVLRLLRFVVGRNRGVRVLFHKKVHIRFKLPAQEKAQVPAPQPVQVQYNYVYSSAVPPTPASSAEPAPASNTYFYSFPLESKD
ncbi:MAG: energy transducer TonB [Saprospirales bacterium]|jgi:TonB family protein|nr:energy transducer TonB [Saprospirales bacterium]